jgi:hypothetical protein
MIPCDQYDPLEALQQAVGLSPRQLWAINRFQMESENIKTGRYGGRSRQHWYLLKMIVWAASLGLKITGQFDRAVRNAWDIRYRQLTLALPDLPASFDGYTLLHISDLHLDGMAGLAEKAADLLAGHAFDLAVLTGDYRSHVHGRHRRAMDDLGCIVHAIDARDGIVATLGNHDDCLMAGPLEQLGVTLLVNESQVIERGDDRLRVIGLDDVHYFYTDQALMALESAADDFTLLAVHSPEIVPLAAKLGVNLYLSGHTHGGQVALPGGRPILTHLKRGRPFAGGVWTHDGMTGYTTSGLGTSGRPVRLNTRGELVEITLRRG